MVWIASVFAPLTPITPFNKTVWNCSRDKQGWTNLPPKDPSLWQEWGHPFTFIRRQFPVRLAFAVTINKGQGQENDRVGIYLPTPVFAHGQLYTAFSRGKKASAVKVFILGNDEGKTNNIVNTQLKGNGCPPCRSTQPDTAINGHRQSQGQIWGVRRQDDISYDNWYNSSALAQIGHLSSWAVQIDASPELQPWGDWKQRFQLYLGDKTKRGWRCSGQFPDICYGPGCFSNHLRYLGMIRISATLC